MTLNHGSSQEGKAMTNVISCTTAVSTAEFTLGPTCEKRGRKEDRSGNGAETD